MSFKKSFYATITVFLLSLTSSVWAANKASFTQEKFQQLQNDGQVVLVDVYADWCGTCRKQQKAISKYVKAHSDRELHILTVDFDNQKDIVKQFKAPRQSTLLLYKGDEQVWFSVGETRSSVIESKIESAFGENSNS